MTPPAPAPAESTKLADPTAPAAQAITYDTVHDALIQAGLASMLGLVGVVVSVWMIVFHTNRTEVTTGVVQAVGEACERTKGGECVIIVRWHPAGAPGERESGVPIYRLQDRLRFHVGQTVNLRYNPLYWDDVSVDEGEYPHRVSTRTTVTDARWCVTGYVLLACSLLVIVGAWSWFAYVRHRSAQA